MHHPSLSFHPAQSLRGPQTSTSHLTLCYSFLPARIHLQYTTSQQNETIRTAFFYTSFVHSVVAVISFKCFSSSFVIHWPLPFPLQLPLFIPLPGKVIYRTVCLVTVVNCRPFAMLSVHLQFLLHLLIVNLHASMLSILHRTLSTDS